MQNDMIYGLTEDHTTIWNGQRVHAAILPDLEILFADAQSAGFHIGIASAFRSFERQLLIWNGKASGLRPVLSVSEQPLDICSLSEEELMHAILRWSALPGASRHHWGTELDIYDAGVVAGGYELQLVQSETRQGGAFGQFYAWLDEYLLQNDGPFKRPYKHDRGGVAPEPWHLSHWPTAREFETVFSIDSLKGIIRSSDIVLKETLLQHMDEIFTRYISVTGDR